VSVCRYVKGIEKDYMENVHTMNSILDNFTFCIGSSDADTTHVMLTQPTMMKMNVKFDHYYRIPTAELCT
jgi:hypothetical protein